MDAMQKLYGGISQIRKVNLRCGSGGLEEVRPTSKDS